MRDRPLYFAIRDDDTSFFTRPEQLESCYGDIWDICPISLSVVPFHACTKSGAVPKEYWSGDEVFPLERNSELVDFLREGVARKRLHITLHGYHHRDEPDGYEFAVSRDLERKVIEGRRYLESLLGQPIKVFVPPHNSLGRDGYRSVIGQGLSISGIQTFRPALRGWDPRIVGLGLKKRILPGCTGRLHSTMVFPDGHREVPYEPLTPPISAERLLHRFDQTLRTGGIFCVATHYWEFDVPGRGHPHTIRQVLRMLWERVTAHQDKVRFATLAELCEL